MRIITVGLVVLFLTGGGLYITSCGNKNERGISKAHKQQLLQALDQANCSEDIKTSYVQALERWSLFRPATATEVSQKVNSMIQLIQSHGCR